MISYVDGLKNENLISYVISFFPENLKIITKNYLYAYSDISEIRIRIGGPLSFTSGANNLVTKIVCQREDISFILDKMTEGNFAKYDEMMRSGYISLENGCRAGVCGKVFSSGGDVKLLLSVESLCLRIPCRPFVDTDVIFDYLKKSEFKSGILIISPPGVGKTTVLRSLCKRLSSAPVSKRVACVDTLDELGFSSSSSLCDFLTGYPKSNGILTATRYFDPEFIICDEICGDGETDAVLEYQHTGVPFIASAHAGDFTDLLLRKNTRKLLENRVFGAVCRLSRNQKIVEYKIKNTEEILK